MIDKIKILELIQSELDGSDKFLVNLKITPDNRIYIDIDGDNGVNIDDCIALSRAIEKGLDRDEEDFALDVSSPGADMPLKLPRQYNRHVGRQLDIATNDGKQIIATLQAIDGDVLHLRTKGEKKRPPVEMELSLSDIRTARIVLPF